MKPSDKNQQIHKAEFPRSDEGMQICGDIARWQTQSYIAMGIGLSNQAVAKWFDRRVKDIFSRVRDFIRGLVDDGRDDFALRILRFICSGIGYQPVKTPPTKVQFLSLFRSACQHQTDSAQLTGLFFEVVQDGIVTAEEAERMLAEIAEERQALTNMEAVYKNILDRAKTQCGGIPIDIDEFKKRMLVG